LQQALYLHITKPGSTLATIEVDSAYPLTMPGIVVSPFSKLEVTELHPTFGAEIEGVDFSQPIPDEVFKEILAASAKAR
jgi:hypothetical protein